MDRALWITWYNLPDQGRDAYLSWLHGTYIPELLKRPGYLWAAHYAKLNATNVPRASRKKLTTSDSTVPKGDQYILLLGAECTSVFGNPGPAALHAGMPPASREMLAMRVEERVNIMTEAARVNGPEAKCYPDGMVLAPCIQLGTFNCDPKDEEDMLVWFAKWRLPAMTSLSGCVRTRKLASVVGWAKHAILYEFASLEARNHFLATHEDAPAEREWTDRVVLSLTHAPGSANVGCRIWPPASA